MPGVCPGGIFKLRFDWYVTNHDIKYITMNFCVAETVLKSWLELIPNAQNVEHLLG